LSGRPARSGRGSNRWLAAIWSRLRKPATPDLPTASRLTVAEKQALMEHTASESPPDDGLSRPWVAGSLRKNLPTELLQKDLSTERQPLQSERQMSPEMPTPPAEQQTPMPEMTPGRRQMPPETAAPVNVSSEPLVSRAKVVPRKPAVRQPLDPSVVRARFVVLALVALAAVITAISVPIFRSRVAAPVPSPSATTVPAKPAPGTGRTVPATTLPPVATPGSTVVKSSPPGAPVRKPAAATTPQPGAAPHPRTPGPNADTGPKRRRKPHRLVHPAPRHRWKVPGEVPGARRAPARTDLRIARRGSASRSNNEDNGTSAAN